MCCHLSVAARLPCLIAPALHVHLFGRRYLNHLCPCPPQLPPYSPPRPSPPAPLPLPPRPSFLNGRGSRSRGARPDRQSLGSSRRARAAWCARQRALRGSHQSSRSDRPRGPSRRPRAQWLALSRRRSPSSLRRPALTPTAAVSRRSHRAPPTEDSPSHARGARPAHAYSRPRARARAHP